MKKPRAKNQQKLHQMTIKWGGYNKPLLVDVKSRVILDGHHRFRIGEALGLKFLPAILIDYLVDDRIQVMTWPMLNRIRLQRKKSLRWDLAVIYFLPKQASTFFWRFTSNILFYRAIKLIFGGDCSFQSLFPSLLTTVGFCGFSKTSTVFD